MKNGLKFLFIAAVILGFSANSFGQESATATATGTIVTPISIENAEDMNFGNVAVQSTSGGTVVLAPSGSRSVTGGVTLPAIEGTVSAASFDIEGAPNYTYSISLPSAATTVSSGSNTMTVNAFTSDPSTTGTLSASGIETINVGATLNVDAAQASGVYESETPFTVTVNYN